MVAAVMESNLVLVRYDSALSAESLVEVIERSAVGTGHAYRVLDPPAAENG